MTGFSQLPLDVERPERGQRLAFPLDHHRTALAVHAVCLSGQPESWHGEVVFAGMTLTTTPPVGSPEEAGRAAELALLELLAGSCV